MKTLILLFMVSTVCLANTNKDFSSCSAILNGAYNNLKAKKIHNQFTQEYEFVRHFRLNPSTLFVSVKEKIKDIAYLNHIQMCIKVSNSVFVKKIEYYYLGEKADVAQFQKDVDILLGK